MKPLALVLGSVALLCACASSRPDHFYILSVEPGAGAEPQARVQTQAGGEPHGAPATRTTRATLKVTLPSLVDRPEMVLNTSAEGVTVLEHERWAAPLTDLVTQTLGQDLERRRADLWIGERSAAAVLKIGIDIIQVTVHTGQRASIEARWRILDSASGTDLSGSDEFAAPLGAGGYGGVPRALSECLGALADRLAGELPRTP